MQTDIFIALVNPSLGLTLSVTFLLFWRQQPSLGYLKHLAAAYLAIAIGFLLQRFELPVGLYPTRFLSNVFFMTGATLMSTGIAARYRLKPPLATVAIIAVAGLCALTWFMVVDDDLVARIYSINFALGCISFVIGAQLLKVRDRSRVDNVLLVMSVLVGLNMFLRTAIAIEWAGGVSSYDELYTSIYWTSAMLTHALLSLAVALCLIMGSAQDVVDALRTEAQTDPLSGLLNRRGFEASAEPLLGLARPAAVPVSLVLADLDHFKKINDAHGHGVGDVVITAFSRLLRTVVGPEATIGRTGGEEFAILVSSCGLSTARLLAEGLRAGLSSNRLTGMPDIVGRVTASFGVATMQPGEDLSSLLRRADEALYRAKREGRNRVCVAGSEVALWSEPTGADPRDRGRFASRG